MPDPVPGPIVSASEQISRFLVYSRWFNLRTKRILGQAFMTREPQSPDTMFRTSVYRIDGCTSEEIWLIGEEFVSKRRLDKRPVRARADIEAQTIFSENLQVAPVPTPHPRHADIVLWPEQPEKHLEKANAMALTAKLVPLPSPQA